MNHEDTETPIHLDLSVETIALLSQHAPFGPLGTDSVPIRSCTSHSECSIPLCCP